MFHFVPFPFWIKKNLDLSESDNFGRPEFLDFLSSEFRDMKILPECRFFSQFKKVIFQIENLVSSGIIP